jgi:hypothetical protein
MAGGSRSFRSGWYLVILLLIFGLAGGAIGEVLGNSVKSLSFLKNYTIIGMSKPLVLDLKLMAVTFGISFNVNILSLVGMFAGFLVYRKM